MRHRPSYVPERARYVPVGARTYRARRPRRWLAVVAGALVLGAVAVLAALLITAGRAVRPGERVGQFVTPSVSTSAAK